MKDFSQSDEATALMQLSSSADALQSSVAALPPTVAMMYSGNGAVGLEHKIGSGPFGASDPARQAATGFYQKIGKRAFDLTLVVLTLPITVFVIAACAVVLWATGGKPFYFQERLGRDGRVFRMAKLRSMVVDAEDQLDDCLAADPALRIEWDTKQKLQDDPRITTLGRFLRATSLDELPQIFNVLTGDMSLVGPRPMMVDQLERYGNPRNYFAMRPGITGVWQVSERNDTAFAARNVLDTKYHGLVSLTLDMWLLIKTIGVVLKGTGR